MKIPRDDKVPSPLHHAVKWGQVGKVRALLEAGADADDRRGIRAPLVIAVKKGNHEIVKTLLEAGADVNGRPGKPPPLVIATWSGNFEIVQTLLEAGADTEIPDSTTGMTPLHIAAAWGRIGCVLALLDAGAKVGAKDTCGMNPLTYAPQSMRPLMDAAYVDQTSPASPGARKENEGRENIMLYWDDQPPAEVSAIVEKWRNVGPAWNVVLFDEGTACEFLRARFGREIARLFLRCAIPAMRSDFFRVFWAMSEGGIYADVAFVPKQKEPLFFNSKKDITITKFVNISNRLFYSKKDSKELKLVAQEIIQSISREEINFVNYSTGPAAWARAIGERETSTMAIIDKKDIWRYVDESGYHARKRPPETHWMEMQQRMNIYREISGKLESDILTSGKS